MVDETRAAQASQRACMEAIIGFVAEHGGLNGLAQWDADHLADFNDQLFAAAVGPWMEPKLTGSATQV